MAESQDEKTQITTSAELQDAGDLELCITHKAWKKLMAYCKAASPNEVSGFMVCERDGQLIYVEDAYIPEQECTGTSTEMKPEGISRLIEYLSKEKIIGRDAPAGRFLSHFHTHPTFGVFWSSTDMEMRKTLRRGCEFYVSLVINNKGEALCALDINGDFPISINNVPITVLDDNQWRTACEEDVKKYLKTPAPTQSWWDWDKGDTSQNGGSFLPGLDQPTSDTPPSTLGEDDVKKLVEGWPPEVQAEFMKMDKDERELALEMGMIHNGRGTWMNIGGEIVKTHGPDGEPLESFT